MLQTLNCLDMTLISIKLKHKFCVLLSNENETSAFWRINWCEKSFCWTKQCNLVEKKLIWNGALFDSLARILHHYWTIFLCATAWTAWKELLVFGHLVKPKHWKVCPRSRKWFFLPVQDGWNFSCWWKQASNNSASDSGTLNLLDWSSAHYHFFPAHFCWLSTFKAFSHQRVFTHNRVHQNQSPKFIWWDVGPSMNFGLHAVLCTSRNWALKPPSQCTPWFDPQKKRDEFHSELEVVSPKEVLSSVKLFESVFFVHTLYATPILYPGWPIHCRYVHQSALFHYILSHFLQIAPRVSSYAGFLALHLERKKTFLSFPGMLPGLNMPAGL